MAPEESDWSAESAVARRERFRSRLYHRVQWSDLDTEFIAGLIDRAAREDLEGAGFLREVPHPGDPTSELFLPADREATAFLRTRHSLTVAGLPLLPLILKRFDPSLTIDLVAEDGETVPARTILAMIKGNARSLFTAERTLLNFIQMLSGIATETQRLARLLEGSPTRLLDTRKTHPGYRSLIKYAVAKGGGWNHRLGLYDRIMLKDNHLGAGDVFSSESALREAVAKARQARPDLPIEVEIDALEQLRTALESMPDVILLDNFDIASAARAIKIIGDEALTEISGSITERNLPELRECGADFVSTGATVHRSRWVDLGLDLMP